MAIVNNTSIANQIKLHLSRKEYTVKLEIGAKSQNVLSLFPLIIELWKTIRHLLILINWNQIALRWRNG